MKYRNYSYTARNAYNNGFKRLNISVKRKKQLRFDALEYYKKMKYHNTGFEWRGLYEYTGCTVAERSFVKGYFNWLANRFGRV